MKVTVDIFKSAALTAIFILFVTIISSSLIFAYERKPAEDWQEYKSDHFIVYYHPSVPQKYVRDFTRKCEKYYDSITRRLGFNRFNFWLWENRARIYVFKDVQSYMQATAAPGWTGAAVHIGKKHIATFYYGTDEAAISQAAGLPTKQLFFNSVLPHEMAHIIFREFIGMETRMPLWLDEGVACFNEKDSDKRYLYYARQLLKEGKAVSVSKLTDMSHADNAPQIFYPMSASLVIFLLEKAGQRSDFVEFCRELRDGTGLYEAIRKVYRIEGAEELNKKFLEFLKR